MATFLLSFLSFNSFRTTLQMLLYNSKNRARICKPFKEPRIDSQPGGRLFAVPARRAT